MFEFEFTLKDDVFYVTNDTNTIDNELLQFLISIDFEFNKVEKNLEFYGPVDKDKVLIKLIGTKININDIRQYKFT